MKLKYGSVSTFTGTYRGGYAYFFFIRSVVSQGYLTLFLFYKFYQRIFEFYYSLYSIALERKMNTSKQHINSHKLNVVKTQKIHKTQKSDKNYKSSKN